MPDSIRPERCERCGSPSCCDHWRGQADKARAEVERLRAERRELREALAFYDPHAPAAIAHEVMGQQARAGTTAVESHAAFDVK
jgi:hypothetical protein